MAEFTKATGSSFTPVRHSKEIFNEVLKKLSWRKQGMMGKKGSGAAIIVDNRLRGQVGDTIRMEFIPHAYADPLRGQDVTILGNENTLEEFGIDVVIDELNFPFRSNGKMTKQRTIWDIRAEMKSQIVNHFTQYNEDTWFKVLSGLAWNNDDKTAWQSATATADMVSGANRCIRADGANGFASVTAANSDNTALVAAMNTSDKLSPRLIEEANVMVGSADATSNDSASTATNTYLMQGIEEKTSGESVFCLYTSLQAARDLRFNSDWQNHSYSLAERGWESSPIARGALGTWDNTIVKKTQRIIKFLDGSSNLYSRNLLIGADAMCCAWAQSFQYTEEPVDHKRKLSVNGSEIRGEVKLAFNGVDTGVAQIVTAG